MIRHCEHIKANGHFCGSPAMRERNYCFFHLNHIGQRLRLERYAAHGLQAPPIELPLLEDAASIQLALMQVSEALLHGTLDHKTAGLVLYSLQTASSNLRNLQKEAEADTGTAVCNRYDSFEEDYELDEASAAGLRVAEPADAHEARAASPNHAAGDESGESSAAAYNPVRALIAQGEALGFMSTKGVCMPCKAGAQHGPQHLTDREEEDKAVRIPLNLTETQYLQAKSSIEEYEQKWGIDLAHPDGRKPAPQRAAISQKIFLGGRKPVASITMEEESQQPATRSEHQVPSSPTVPSLAVGVGT